MIYVRVDVCTSIFLGVFFAELKVVDLTNYKMPRE